MSSQFAWPNKAVAFISRKKFHVSYTDLQISFVRSLLSELLFGVFKVSGLYHKSTLSGSFCLLFWQVLGPHHVNMWQWTPVFSLSFFVSVPSDTRSLIFDGLPAFERTSAMSEDNVFDRSNLALGDPSFTLSMKSFFSTGGL